MIDFLSLTVAGMRLRLDKLEGNDFPFFSDGKSSYDFPRP